MYIMICICICPIHSDDKSIVSPQVAGPAETVAGMLQAGFNDDPGRPVGRFRDFDEYIIAIYMILMDVDGF